MKKELFDFALLEFKYENNIFTNKELRLLNSLINENKPAIESVGEWLKKERPELENMMVIFIYNDYCIWCNKQHYLPARIIQFSNSIKKLTTLKTKNKRMNFGEKGKKENIVRIFTRKA